MEEIKSFSHGSLVYATQNKVDILITFNEEEKKFLLGLCHVANGENSDLSRAKLFNQEKCIISPSGDWYRLHTFPFNFRTWPKALLEYYAWLKRVAAAKSEYSKEWGIQNMIMLFVVDIH